MTTMNQPENFTATVTVLDDYGLHARPAANLAKVAQSFQADITLRTEGQSADAKSILDILALAAGRNAEVTLECSGADAEHAGETIVRLFQSKFNPSDAS